MERLLGATLAKVAPSQSHPKRNQKKFGEDVCLKKVLRQKQVVHVKALGLGKRSITKDVTLQLQMENHPGVILVVTGRVRGLCRAKKPMAFSGCIVTRTERRAKR
jgi:hypothetical protein